MQQSNAVIAHDAEAQLNRIKAPTLLTFGRHDVATSTRFADPMKGKIRNSELLIFDGLLLHAYPLALYPVGERVFNLMGIETNKASDQTAAYVVPSFVPRHDALLP
jgi:hypothetical protein